MTTSLDTIKKLVLKMKQELDAVASTNLQENRKIFDRAGLIATLPQNIRIEPIQLSPKFSADWIKPEKNNSTEKQPLILFLHGGGFSVGSSISHRPLCARIADSSQCNILVVNYRLAPEHRYPVALEDALFSYQWLLKNYPGRSIIVMGDSAGGGLAMALLLLIKEKSFPMPAGAVGISAWLDLECTSASYQTNKEIDLLASAEGLRFVGRGYANKKINKDPLVSPFYATDLSGLCPLLLQVGGAETLLDENKLFATQAKKYGVAVELQVWPHMVHVWHSLYGMVPEAAEAIDAIAAWVNKQ